MKITCCWTSSSSQKHHAGLNLKINKDFTLADVRERGTSGIQTHFEYKLTPEAFKKIWYYYYY